MQQAADGFRDLHLGRFRAGAGHRDTWSGRLASAAVTYRYSRDVLTPEQEQQAISLIRGLAIDAPLYAKSGHQGTAMALAPLAHVLYSRIMSHDPADSQWPDRDRFILSAGHASILQYALLFLAGYGLELDDIKAFRQWESATPGHPEVGHTAGVEVTTGPLGQGFANSVGMALAERHLRARFGADLVEHFTFVIAGDGCLMEGVSHEAASLAGHHKLGNLVCIYDDNHITIDGDTALSYSDDAAMRFEAYGWHVEDLGEVADDLRCTRGRFAPSDGRHRQAEPAPAQVAHRLPQPGPHRPPRGPRQPVHRGAGCAHQGRDGHPRRAVLGAGRSRGRVSHPLRRAGRRGPFRLAGTFRYCLRGPRCVARLLDGHGLPGWDAALPTFEQGDKIATRVAIEKAFNATLDLVPGLVAGAADLTGNTGTKLTGQVAAGPSNPGGRQVYYGIREHAMGAAMVGMALHGGVLPAGGTFFVFLDYMRPAVRLAALSGAKVVFVFTHDSVGVGEDGPTHQPVEHLATLQGPSRPAGHPPRRRQRDRRQRGRRQSSTHGPTALVLSRQNLTVCTDGSAVDVGAAVVRDSDVPQVVLLAHRQ